jgi:hypothetical protein
MEEIMRKENGGPAFPTNANLDVNGEKYLLDEGMTLRDYFAAHALPETMTYVTDNPDDDLSFPDDVAERVYLVADAMLKERKK